VLHSRNTESLRAQRGTHIVLSHLVQLLNGLRSNSIRDSAFASWFDREAETIALLGIRVLYFVVGIVGVVTSIRFAEEIMSKGKQVLRATDIHQAEALVFYADITEGVEITLGPIADDGTVFCYCRLDQEWVARPLVKMFRQEWEFSARYIRNKGAN
jgi:hypothetical protein